MLYLLKASGCLAGLTLVYGVLLRNTTFHRLNRPVLLLILAASLVMPLLVIPDLGFAGQPAAVRSFTPAPVFAYQTFFSAATESNISGINASWNKTTGLLCVYWVVVAVLLGRLLAQLFTLGRLVKGGTQQPAANYILIRHPEVQTPFSFFRYVVVPPEPNHSLLYGHALRHESIHASQLHSLDRLLSEVYTIFFWFNPLTWFHRFLLKQNLEYLTDQQVLRDGIPEKEYQYSLLQVVLPRTRLGLANHFTHSLLKSRIWMINRKESSAMTQWRYGFLLVAAAGMLLLFSATQARQAAQPVEAPYAYKTGPGMSAVSPADDRPPAALPADHSGRVMPQTVRTVSGTVKDADSEELLAGVKVQAKSAGLATVTDDQGRFTLTIPAHVKTLVFSARDYPVTERVISDQAEVVVRLRSKFAQKLEAILEQSPKGDFFEDPARFNFRQLNFQGEPQPNLEPRRNFE